MAAANVEQLTLVVDGVHVFCRRVEGEGTPTVYVHGNPTHSEDWLPFMRRGGAAVAVDLPGWGRSDRPDPDRFDYTMHGLDAFHERCLEELGVGRRKLVVHDWGALALIGAQRRPELVERLVVSDAVPLLPGYRWHWVARLWRRRGIGELLMATNSRVGTALGLRDARGDRAAMPREFVDMIWRHWDRGTSRAILRLYRDADPERLAEAGRDLGRLDCPALVVWGERDRYLPSRFGRIYAERLPGAEYLGLANAGHWPWLEDPSLIDRVAAFLAEDPKTVDQPR
jgi:pimeloyl-ACP methyl ester carboxylesterase